MGSPTIIADINSVSPTAQVAARLVDIGPTGTETLVGRGIYRPEINSGTEATRQVFQLHPNGWKFDTGHIAKLELLPADQPYGRSSNGQAPYTVSNLELRLPVLENPGDLGGLVQGPAPKVVPDGYELAGDFETRVSAPEGRDADLRAARARIRALHEPGPPARPAARVRVLQLAAADLRPAHGRHARRQSRRRQLGRRGAARRRGRRRAGRGRNDRRAQPGLAHRLHRRAAGRCERAHHRPQQLAVGHLARDRRGHVLPDDG